MCGVLPENVPDDKPDENVHHPRSKRSVELASRTRLSVGRRLNRRTKLPVELQRHRRGHFLKDKETRGFRHVAGMTRQIEIQVTIPSASA